MVDGEHQIIKGKNNKKREIDEKKDLALVNLKRMVEKNKAEKMQ